MQETGLIKYDSMCKAIIACHKVDEVKDIRAERKAGQLLREEKASGARDAGKGGDRKSQSPDTTVKTLNEIGVSKDQSSKWQKLADIPADDFERAKGSAA